MLHLLALIKLEDVIINKIHFNTVLGGLYPGETEVKIRFLFFLAGSIYMAFSGGYLFTYYLVPLSMALDNAPVCLFKWKLRSKLWRWRKVRRATLRIDPWATLANTAFLNSLKSEALVRAAPSTNHKRVTISVNFI